MRTTRYFTEHFHFNITTRRARRAQKDASIDARSIIRVRLVGVDDLRTRASRIHCVRSALELLSNIASDDVRVKAWTVPLDDHTVGVDEKLCEIPF